MKKFLLLISFSGSIFFLCAQNTENQFRNLQELEKEMAQAKTPEAKTNALISLYIFHAAHSEPVNRKESKNYQQQLEIYTHQTNNPELIAQAFLALTFSTRGDDLKKRIDRLSKYSKLHNLPYYQARAKFREATYNFTVNADPGKTSQLANEALNLAKDLSDSLQVLVYIQAGGGYSTLNNQLQALQFAFRAYDIASRKNSLELMRLSNVLFEEIYRKLEDYYKALEYNQKTLVQSNLLKKPHLTASRHARAAVYYFRIDQPVLGNHHVKEAFRIADSIKGSRRLYNEITGQIVGGLSLSDHDDVLADFLKNYRQHFFISSGAEFLDNITLARAYAKIGNIDSARVLVNRARAYYTDNKSNNLQRIFFYTLARLALFDKDWSAAIENYKKCLHYTVAQNDLNLSVQYTDSLKHILVQQNMLPEAIRYYEFGDSLKKEFNKQLDKEEITKQEVAALEKEKEFQSIQKETEKQQRYNIQYLGITFGVVTLFIILLLMGIFQVSARTIKILGFFSFLLFFEFIFLIFKKQIAVITHGEPLKDLAFMVLLAAVMVPLHHWGEHKAVSFLSSKKFILPANKIFSRKVGVKKNPLP